MSIVLIRDAFTQAAGDKLILSTLTMQYSDDGRAQTLRATGATPEGVPFQITTAPLLGDATVLQQRAVQMVAELLNPDERQRGTTITFTADAHAQQPQQVAAPAEPERKAKPHVAPPKVRR